MEHTQVSSSLLQSIAYDKATKILEIQFKGKKEGEAGKVYRYANVTQETYERFRAAQSLGSHFLKQIKNQHACTRVEEKPDAEDEKKASEGRKPFATSEPPDGAPF